MTTKRLLHIVLGSLAGGAVLLTADHYLGINGVRLFMILLLIFLPARYFSRAASRPDRGDQ